MSVITSFLVNSVFVFVRLVFLSHSRTITVKGLQILIYTRHSWPLSSEGYLTCFTYCDTGQPFIMVISEDPWRAHLLPSIWHRAVTTCFKDLGLSLLGIEPQSPALVNCVLNTMVFYSMKKNVNKEHQGTPRTDTRKALF